VANEAEPRRCPVCGRGSLVDIAFREGSTLAEQEDIQEADTRQVETYSCGHEVRGPGLDATAASDDLQVERRNSDETAEPV
jgi:hypothetical protein